MATQSAQKSRYGDTLLNVHTRYDRPQKKKDLLPHYPKEIRTTYGKDYIPTDVTVPHTLTIVDLPKRDDGTAAKLRNVPAVRTAYKTEFGAKKGQPDHRDEIYARFKKTHPGGDLLNKDSEYVKKFATSAAKAAEEQFERPTVKLAAWQKTAIPVEGTSTTKKFFTAQPLEKAGIVTAEARADFVNVFHRNRNGQVVGHKFDPLSKNTDYRVEYPTRTLSASHLLGPSATTASGAVRGPHPPIESSTNYRRHYVNYHVRHSQLVDE